MRVAPVGCGRWNRNILRDLMNPGADVPDVGSAARTRARARPVRVTGFATATDRPLPFVRRVAEKREMADLT